ncbi:LysR substrate-binding domain-containing protein [Pseudactinotalea suaedae]|uniref:LysR substrate-binding domain-containing protein n=1 Tax=Pseudactinotalea suaedae TaxID=1524924 RepID=UPI0012E1C3DE|nr:LysR substrate-binding domain-containing protein [Pseudactinotalea suaedae]
MFTLDQLRGFVAVAEELHFGRAAQRLLMTQPPLSRQIQKLERAVGARLLDRDQRSVSLTAAGQAFLEDARRMLATADAALARARRVEAGATGTVRLAFTAGSALGVLPTILDVATRSLPDVHLELVEMVSIDQVRHVAEGSIDVGLARPPFPAELLGSVLVQRERLLLAVPAVHRWARGEGPIALTEAVGEPLIMYSPAEARYFHDLLVRLMPAPGPRVVHMVTQVLTMLSLVAAGRGVALVPESSRRMRLEGVAYRELAGVPQEPVELHLMWAKESRNPAMHALVEQARQTFEPGIPL